MNKMRDYSKMTQEHLHKKLEEFAIQEKKLQDLDLLGGSRSRRQKSPKMCWFCKPAHFWWVIEN